MANIADQQSRWARDVAAAFEAADLRVALDDRNETLGRKIAEAHAAGTPVVAIVGAAEAASGSVTLRRRDRAQERLPLAAAVADLPAARLDEQRLRAVAYGQAILIPDLPKGEIAVGLTAMGELAAILRYNAERQEWRPEKVFL